MSIDGEQQSEFMHRLAQAEQRHDTLEAELAAMRTSVAQLTDAVLRHVTRRQEASRLHVDGRGL